MQLANTPYYSVYRPRKDERLSRPVWLVTYRNKVPPPGVEPGHVTHPSNYNQARRRVTSLIRPTLLPLRHATVERMTDRWHGDCRWSWRCHGYWTPCSDTVLCQLASDDAVLADVSLSRGHASQPRTRPRRRSRRSAARRPCTRRSVGREDPLPSRTVSPYFRSTRSRDQSCDVLRRTAALKQTPTPTPARWNHEHDGNSGPGSRPCANCMKFNQVTKCATLRQRWLPDKHNITV